MTIDRTIEREVKMNCFQKFTLGSSRFFYYFISCILCNLLILSIINWLQAEFILVYFVFALIPILSSCLILAYRDTRCFKAEHLPSFNMTSTFKIWLYILGIIAIMMMIYS